MAKKKSSDASDRKLDKLSFEDALHRLEEIVRELEEGEQGLEDSIRLYEEGRQLVRHSMKRLGEAQSRIEELVKTEEGWDTVPVADEPEQAGSSRKRGKVAKEPAEDELPF